MLKDLFNQKSFYDQIVSRKTHNLVRSLSQRLCMILLLSLVGIGSAWAQKTIDDLVEITSNYSFTFTETVTTNALSGDGHFIAIENENAYADNRNGVQIKSNRQMAFKVAAGAKITIDFGRNGDRILQLGTTKSATDVATSTSGELVARCQSATILYLSASSDLYVSKISVTFGYDVTYNTNGIGGTIPMLEGVTALPSEFEMPTFIGKIAEEPYKGVADSGNGLVSFQGWYVDAEFTTPATAGASISENTTLYAKWESNVARLAYNANGATSGDVPATTYHHKGATTHVSGNTGELTRTGYSFSGWFLKGSPTIYSEGSNFTTNNNYTLRANWVAQQYTVTYDANGGDCATPSADYTYDGDALELPTPTRAGFTFDGWYTAASGGTRVLEIGSNYKPAENITLFAHWSCSLEHGGVTIGNLDQTTGYNGASTETFAIDRGQTKQFTFNNHGNASENWHNWNLEVNDGETPLLILRADKYDVCVGNGNGIHFYINDVDSNPETVDWDNFKNKMKDAQVNATIAYANDGTMTITVISNCGDIVYKEEITKNGMEGTKYIRFFVDLCHITNFKEVANTKNVKARVNPAGAGTVTVKVGERDYTEQAISSDGADIYEGSLVTVEAIPNEGYKFDLSLTQPWGNATSSQNNPLDYNGSGSGLNGDKTFTANFVELTAPVITTQPAASANYSKGETVTPLTVVATTSEGGSLSYQWYSNSTNSNVGGVAIPGQTSASYTPSASTTGITYYYCVVTENVDKRNEAGAKAYGETSTASNASCITVSTECSLEHTGDIIGNKNQTTPYHGARTEATLIAKGEKQVFRFTNHGNDDANWNNWNLVLATAESKPTGTEIETEEMVLRSDKYGWGPMYDGVSGTNIGASPDNIFVGAMHNAEVEVSVEFNASDNKIYIESKSVGNGQTYTQSAVTKVATEGDKYIYFVVDKSHICNYRELKRFRAVTSNGTLNSITVNSVAQQGVASNEDIFVEPDASIVVTATCDGTRYLKNWVVNGTAGVATENAGTYTYTIAQLKDNTTITAKFEVKSSETVPAPENATCDQPEGQTPSSFTVTEFASSEAGKDQTIKLNLPFGAIAAVKSGYTGTVNGDDLTITAPAQDANGSTIIVVTAHDGITQAEYTLYYSTGTDPSYTYKVQAVDGSGNVLNGNIASGEASSAVVAYPQYILKGSTLYNIPQGSGDWYRKTVQPTHADYVETLTYNGTSVSDVVFYIDAEDIEGFSKANNPQRASKGQMGYGNKTAVTTLKPGTYQIYARGVNGNSTPRNAVFTVGDNDVWTFSINDRNTNVTGNSAYFSINEATTLYVSCEGSSVSGLDWFYVQKSDVLVVTENHQKFACLKSVVDNADYAVYSVGKEITSNTKQDGFNGSFYGIKQTTDYISVTESGALAFMVKAFHNNSSDTRTVTIKLDGENVGTLSVKPGELCETPAFAISNPENRHTISIYGGGKDVYIADIEFLTEDPEGELTTSESTIKMTDAPKNYVLSSTSGGAITVKTDLDSPEVTEFANISYNEGTKTLTVEPVKAGTVTLEFDIAENGAYAAGTSTYTINVVKEKLTLTLSKDEYRWNKTTTPEQPEFTQPTVTIKDESNHTVSNLPLVYDSDDNTVATIDADGHTINIDNEANGSANVYISFNGNDKYEPAYGLFTVLIEQGYSNKVESQSAPNVTQELKLTKTGGDGEEVLVYATFGGWKYTGNDYSVDGSTKTDSWGTPSKYTGAGGTKPTYVDGYDKAISGATDAMDEGKFLSEEVLFGKQRNGWFKSNVDDPHIRPFSLPVRGAYMTFEPTQNGMLTVYLLQNGAFNTTAGADGSSKIKPGEFQPHSFHVVDQNGTAVPQYTEFSFIVKEPVTQKDADGNPIVCNYDDAKKSIDYDNYTIPSGITYVSNDVSTWPMFYTNYTKAERTAIKDAWNTGKNDAQKVVMLHDHSFFLTQKAYVKYTFYVAASQTYYMFSNFSKLGFAGMNFVPDADQPDQEHDVLALRDDAPTFPTLKNASENVSTKLSIPQYGTIKVNRSFQKDTWSTICLPFDMTEREVRENFGDNAQLLVFDGIEDNGGSQTLHFFYHEIQSILAGYPYLINPSKDVTVTDNGDGTFDGGIVVHNKLIQPKNNGTPSAPHLDYHQPKELLTFSANRYWSATPYVEEPTTPYYTFTGTYNGDAVKKGDVFVSNTGMLSRMTGTSANLKGYRAFIKSKDENNNAKELKFSYSRTFSVDENTGTSGIVEISVDEDEAISDNTKPSAIKGVFTINGQKVSDNLHSLPRGLYIVNGKKMFIK